MLSQAEKQGDGSSECITVAISGQHRSNENDDVIEVYEEQGGERATNVVWKSEGYIKLKVVGLHDGESHYYVLTMSTELGKLKKLHCEEMVRKLWWPW